MTDGQRTDGVSVPPRSWPVRQLMVTLCMVAVVLGGAGLPTTVAAETEPADRPDASTAIVEQAVTRELATVGRTDFWVTFEDQADLSEADKIDDWAERGQYVYDQLTATAKAGQADLIDELREEGAEYESFWITNTVLVRGGDQAALDTARLASGVAEIRADEPVKLPDPIKDRNTDDGGARVNAVEWGIANIRADQVWSDFGVCAVRGSWWATSTPVSSTRIRPWLGSTAGTSAMVRSSMTTTGGTPPRYVGARRCNRATTSVTARTRWVP